MSGTARLPELNGSARMLDGLLLLSPPTATRAAVVHLPPILNNGAITFAMRLPGTRIITGLMQPASFGRTVSGARI